MPNRLNNFAFAMVDCFGDRAHDVAVKLSLEAASSDQSVHEAWLAVVKRIEDLHLHNGPMLTRLK